MDYFKMTDSLTVFLVTKHTELIVNLMDIYNISNKQLVDSYKKNDSPQSLKVLLNKICNFIGIDMGIVLDEVKFEKLVKSDLLKDDNEFNDSLIRMMIK